MAKTTVPDLKLTAPQTAEPKFAGLSDEQVLRIFTSIASKANMMADMCRAQADRSREHESALTFHALITMLCGIGALADMPTGGDVVGDCADWMC